MKKLPTVFLVFGALFLIQYFFFKDINLNVQNKLESTQKDLDSIKESLYKRNKAIFYPKEDSFSQSMIESGVSLKSSIKIYYQDNHVVLAGFLVKGGYTVHLFSLENFTKINTVNFISNDEHLYQDDRYFIVPSDYGIVYYKLGDRDFILIKDSEILDKSSETYIANLGNITNRYDFSFDKVNKVFNISIFDMSNKKIRQAEFILPE